MKNKNKLYSLGLASVTVIIFLILFSSVSSAATTPYAYITTQYLGNVYVINTATNTVATTLTGFNSPFGVAVTPDGTKVYVTNRGVSTVSVINTATNTITDPVPVGKKPYELQPHQMEIRYM